MVKLYNESGSLWQTFYKTLDRFRTAFSAAVQRQVSISLYGPTEPTTTGSDTLQTVYGSEPSETVKEQIFDRDSYTCQACGATGKRFKLQVDHIVPVKFGGGPEINNLQTLCRVCNGLKSVNAINFKIFVTPLSSPKECFDLLQPDGRDSAVRSITRLVNFFYHCQAVREVRMNERRTGNFFSTWEIELYAGNDPNWLRQHKAELLNHVQHDLNCHQVLDIRIISPCELGIPENLSDLDKHVCIVEKPNPQVQMDLLEKIKLVSKERDKYRCLCCGEDNHGSLLVDYVTPSYLQGKDEIDNFQTVCAVCHSEKGVDTMNFRETRTELTTCPIWLRQLPIHADLGSPTILEWEQFIRRTINFFYRCSAVRKVWLEEKGGKYFGWRVELEEGNDVHWLKQFAQKFLEHICEIEESEGHSIYKTLTIESNGNCVTVSL
jgi:5-methylcytosine-specific restriction endonuclease McrA